MCIIIVKPAGVKIENAEQIFANSIESNKHGWGMIISNKETNKVEVIRFFGGNKEENVKKIMSYYLLVEDESIVFHARAASGGTNIDKENVHPFEILNDTWLVHNGNIDIDITDRPSMCDSYHFAKHIGKEYQTNVLDKGWDRSLGEWLRWDKNRLELDRIVKKNKNSKVVIMDKDGFIIFNEGEGLWREGVWYSNRSAFQQTDRIGGSLHYPVSSFDQKGKTFQELLQEHKDLDTKYGSRKMLNEDEIREIEGRLGINISLKGPVTEAVVKALAKPIENKDSPVGPDVISEPPPNKDDFSYWSDGPYEEVFPFLDKCLNSSVNEIKKLINKNHFLAAKAMWHLINKEVFRPVELEEPLQSDDKSCEQITLGSAPLWACNFHEQHYKDLKVLFKANGDIMFIGCENCWEVYRTMSGELEKENKEETAA